MSYLVLARKWRPQIFSAVIGQEHITETLMKAVEKNRVAHAYLFAGPRGCGKTTTARLLAKIINCESPRGAEPCNECASCVAVAEGRHLDVIEIDGASNRGIDEIRDLREKLSYAPSQSRSKIYIIDEVHMLTPQAFNALLKTLEEPPAHVYLVFATTEPHKVPATIISRCQRFNFKRLEVREIASQLEKICAVEKIAHEAEALTLISRRAEGSMRDAESLLDQCIAASDGSVSLDLVRRVLGLVDAQLVVELLKRISGRDRKGALAIVDRVVDSGLDLEEFFLAYIEGLRNLLVLSVQGGASTEFLDLSAGEMEELGAVAKELGTENLLYLFRSAVRGHRDLKSSGQPRYQLEAIFAEAASWESAVEISELIRRLDGTGGGGQGEGQAPRAPSRGAKGVAPFDTAPAAPPAPSAVSPAGATAKPIGAAVLGGGIAVAPAAGIPGAAAGAAIAKAGADVVPPAEGAFARVDRSVPLPARSAGDGEALEAIGGAEQWERFLSRIREAKLTLGIWLVSAGVKKISGDRIVLSFSPQNRFAREMVLEEKNRRFIEFHLERFFGRRLFIEAGEDSDEVAEAKTAENPPPPRAAMDPGLAAIADGSSAIKKLIEEFDGELFTERSDEQEASGK
jgi:DNA polymerase-3 subunit gamma/tau